MISSLHFRDFRIVLRHEPRGLVGPRTRAVSCWVPESQKAALFWCFPCRMVPLFLNEAPELESKDAKERPNLKAKVPSSLWMRALSTSVPALVCALQPASLRALVLLLLLGLYVVRHTCAFDWNLTRTHTLPASVLHKSRSCEIPRAAFP